MFCADAGWTWSIVLAQKHSADTLILIQATFAPSVIDQVLNCNSRWAERVRYSPPLFCKTTSCIKLPPETLWQWEWDLSLIPYQPPHMSRVSVTKSQRYPKWSVCNVCAAQQVLINMLLQSAIRYTAWCWQWSWLRWISGKWFLFQGRWPDDFVQREVSARIIRIDVVASRCWFHWGQLLFSLLAVRQCNFKWKSTAPLPKAVLCHISVIWALRSSAE